MASNKRSLASTNGCPALPLLANDKDMPVDLSLVSLFEGLAEVSSITTPDPGSLGPKDPELRRLLSLKMSYASREVQPTENSYRKIGAGACGVILAQEKSSSVIKLAKNDHMSLWNDFHMHRSIERHFQDWDFTEVRIPCCYYYSPKENNLYFKNCPEAAQVARHLCHLPTSVLVTQRIAPLPERARILLIDKYCAPRIKEAALRDASNKECLVRVYLGSLEGKSERLFFSLRNFKLHLNQMVDLQLDIKMMAGRIGVAMALMHWAAETDARDVEFVLGSDPMRPSFTMRSTELWVLDFNQVQPITMDEAGVAKAVEAAGINDPYLPKPLGESTSERQAWNTFAGNYIRAADIILEDKGQKLLLKLPRMFIRGLIELQKLKREAKKLTEKEEDVRF
ncbi:zinc finger domain-containing protein [Trichoderma sp. SZMC 28013]